MFSEAQRLYAGHGIALFPVDADKRPMVGNYLKLGPQASERLAERFPHANAYGFAPGERSGITVLDVDTPDERVLADALNRHGPTPLIVRSGSRNWQAWYRHNGEGRKVRPDPKEPIDILGGGYVVAPTSRGAKGSYLIVQGSLADLDRLPFMRGSEAPDLEAIANDNGIISEGRRNNDFLPMLLKHVRDCGDYETLLGVARVLNMELCRPPLDDRDVIAKCKWAWEREMTGNNWVGRKARATTNRAEILSLDSHALRLLMLLKVSHPTPGDQFAISQEETAALMGWGWRAMKSAIRALLAAEHIRRVHVGGTKRGDPHLYQLTPEIRGPEWWTI